MERWLEALSDEDAAFVKRFVLASGSLKEMAQVYGVSYPTVRLRLDRLIEKIKLLDSQPAGGPLATLLRMLYADGKLDLTAMRSILETHKKELEDRHEKPER